MPQFVIVPSADVNASGAIQSLSSAILSDGNVITVPGGVYRAFATADISVLFTPTGSNFTPGPTVITGASTTQFLVVPELNMSGGSLLSLSESFVTTNLTVTGLLSGRPYRAIALTEPSDPINTTTEPDAFADAMWGVTNSGTGGILDFAFTAVPYNGGSALTDIKIYENGSITPISTGLTSPGNYQRSGLTNGQLYSYSVAASNAVGTSPLSPAKTQTPTAAPPPPPTNDALVDGLASGVTARGVQTPTSGMKVVGIDALPAGISFATDYVSFDSFTGDFDDPQGWNFGDRIIIIKSRLNKFRNVYTINQRARLLSQPLTGSHPGMRIMPGGGINLMEFCTSEGSRAPMVVKQEQGGILATVRRCHLFNFQQDAIKVTGGNLIEENMFGSLAIIGGTPHSDALTCMAAQGGVVYRNNYIDWVYNNTTDQTGINNWFRFEAYTVGAVFDNIDIYGNRMHHGTSGSFAIHITTKNSPVWNGSVRFNNNRLQKAGTLGTILYAPSVHLSEWNNNINMATGQVIPLSAI